MAFEYKRNRNQGTSETTSPKFTYTRDKAKREENKRQQELYRQQEEYKQQQKLANFQSDNKAMDFFLTDKRPELKTAGANEITRLADEYNKWLERENYYLGMDIPAQEKVLGRYVSAMEEHEQILRYINDLESEKGRIEGTLANEVALDGEADRDRERITQIDDELSKLYADREGIATKYELPKDYSLNALNEEIKQIRGDVAYAKFKQKGAKLTEYALTADDFETNNAYGRDGYWRDDVVETFIDAFPDLNTNAIWNENEFYAAMTEQEKKILGYYIAHGSYEYASDYVNYLRETVGNKVAEQHRKDNDTWYERLGYAVMSGGDTVRQGLIGIGDMIVGDTDYRPSSPLQQGSQLIRQDIDKENNGDWSFMGVAYDVTNTTTAMLPTIALSIASPAAGAALMGTVAGGNAYREMANEGGTWLQSVGYGALVGTSEALMERVLGGVVGYEKLSRVLMPKLKKAAARVALKIGEDIVSEFSEEALQSVLEPLFKSWVTNTDFESPDWEEVLYSGMLGAITGGMFSGTSIGGATIADVVSQRLAQLELQTNTGENLLKGNTAQEDIKTLIDNANERGDKKLKKAADKVAKTEKDGVYTASAKKVGKLATLSEVDRRQLIVDAVKYDNATKRNAIQKLEEGGFDKKTAEKTFETLMRDIASKEQSKELKKAMEKNANVKALYESLTDYYSEGAVADRMAKASAASPVTQVTERIQDARLKNADIEVVQDTDTDAEKDDAVSIESVDDYGMYTVKTESGNSVVYKGDELTMSNATHKKMSYASLFSANGAKAYFALAPNNAGYNYNSQFNEIYQQGITNESFTKIESDMPEDVQKAIYEAGKADREASIKRSEDAKQAAKEKESAFVKKQMGFKSNRVTVSDAALEVLKTAQENGKGEQHKSAIEVIEGLAKMLQVNINIVAAEVDENGNIVGSNGQYNRRTNTFTFDITAGSKHITDITYSAMVKTAGHELTHFIQNWSPSKYIKLKNTTLNFLKKTKGEAWLETQIKAAMSNNAAIGQKLTIEQAKDEVVADAFVNVLTEVDFAETVLRADKGLFEKVHTWVNDNLKDFNKALKIATDDVGGNTDASDVLKQAGAEARALYQEWADAFATALENSTSQQTDVDGDVQNQARTTQLAEMREEYHEVSKEAREAKKQLDLLGEYPRMNEFFAAIDSKDIKLIDEMTADYNRWQEESGYNAANEKSFTLGKKASELYGNIQRLEEELSRELRERKYTEEEIAKYVQKAVRKYHTTTQLNKASYLLTTGSLLDFSEGQRYRVQDHREIAEILDLPDYAQYADGMIVFMNMGNIRLQTYGIDISAMPNSKQLSALRSIIPSVMREYDEFTVDFSKPNGNSDGSVTYPEGVATARILSDIKSYFDTGVVPEYDDSLSQFYQARNKSYWRTNMSHEEVLHLEQTAQKELDTTDNFIDRETKWLYNIKNDTPYFALYSTNKTESPTILYASKGNMAIYERDYIKLYIKEEQNLDRIDLQSKTFSEILQVDRNANSIRNVHSGSSVGRRIDNGADTLHSANKRIRPSKALQDILRDIGQIQLENGRDILKSDPDTQNQARSRERLDTEARYDIAQSVLKYVDTLSDSPQKAKLKANAIAYASEVDKYEIESDRYDTAVINGWDEMAAVAYQGMTMAKMVIDQIETDSDFALTMADAVGTFEQYSESEKTKVRNEYKRKYENAIKSEKTKNEFLRNELRAAMRDISDSERKAKQFAQREKKANYRAKQIELRVQRDHYTSMLLKERTRLKNAIEKPTETASVPKDANEVAKGVINLINALNAFNGTSALTKSSAELVDMIMSIGEAEVRARKSKSVIARTAATDKVMLNATLAFRQVKQQIDSLLGEYKKLSPKYELKDGEKAPSAAASIVYNDIIHEALQDLSESFNTPEMVLERGLDFVYEGLKIVRALNHQLLNANQMYIKGKSVDVLKLRNRLYEDAKRSSAFLNKVLGNKFVSNVLTPKTMIHIAFGATENADTFYDMLNDGQTRYIRFLNGAKDIFAPVAREIENEKFKSDKPTLKTGLKYTDGTDVLLNYEFALSLIKIVENEDSLRHAVWGGLQIPDLEPYNKGDKKTAYNSKRMVEHARIVEKTKTDEDVTKRIEDALSKGEELTNDDYLAMYAEQIAWNNRLSLATEIEAKYKKAAEMLKEQMSKTDVGKQALVMLSCMTKYYDQYARKYLNEATMELYGFEKTLKEGKTYYPIRVIKGQLDVSDNTDIVRDYSLESWGAMKHRMDSKKGIELYGALTELESYMENTAKFYAWTNVTKNMKRILNTQIVEDNGEITSLVSKINQMYGTYDASKKYSLKNKFMSGFEQYMKDLQTEIVGANKSGNGELWAKMQGAFVTNALLLNISTPLVQFSALPLVAVDSGYISMLKSAVKDGRGKIPTLLSKAQKEYVAKYSEVYKYRSGGLISVDLVAAKQNKGVVSKALSSPGLAWTESADAQVLGKQFYALLDRVKRTHKGISAEEAARIAGRQLDETIYEFQANYTVLQRAPLMRGSGLSKLIFGTFRTQQITLLNAVVDSAVKTHSLTLQMKNAKKGSAEYEALHRKRNASHVRTVKIQAALAISNAFNAAIRMGVGLLRRKDDEEKMETAWYDFLDSYLTMFPLIGDIASFLIKQANDQSFYGDEAFGLGMLDVITEAIQSVADIYEMATNNKDDDNKKFVKESLNILALMGIPARNAYNIIKMLFGWAEDAADAAGFDWDIDADEW